MSQVQRRHSTKSMSQKCQEPTLVAIAPRMLALAAGSDEPWLSSNTFDLYRH